MDLTAIAAFATVAGVVLTALVVTANILIRIGRLTQEVHDLKESHAREFQSFKDSQTRELQSFREFQTQELQSFREFQTQEIQAFEQRMMHNHEILRTELQAFEQRMMHNHEILRADIQRVFEALVSHTHDTDGNVVFRVPPTGSLAEPEESPGD